MPFFRRGHIGHFHGDEGYQLENKQYYSHKIHETKYTNHYEGVATKLLNANHIVITPRYQGECKGITQGKAGGDQKSSIIVLCNLWMAPIPYG
jgi:hypothetical protein